MLILKALHILTTLDTYMPATKNIGILNLIKCNYQLITSGNKEYSVIALPQVTGLLYMINCFLSGHIRMRSRTHRGIGGAYPYQYKGFVEHLFGPTTNGIELCAGSVHGTKNLFTVDINPATRPNLIDDAQELSSIQDSLFNRAYIDAPYHKGTAKSMYNCAMPSITKLLKSAARVCQPGSLFFLLHNQNYQPHPPRTKRLGLIYISCIPSSETRCLNVFIKYK